MARRSTSKDKGTKRKYVCMNPMEIFVNCKSCGWEEVLSNNYDHINRKRICPHCKNKTRVIMK